MSILVDSDILIEVARGRNAGVVSKWIELSNSDAAILYCAVSLAELWADARQNEYDALDKLFGALTCCPIAEEIGRRAGIYLQRHRRSHGIEIADALIAATAVVNRAELWTRNRKHYPMRDVCFFE